MVRDGGAGDFLEQLFGGRPCGHAATSSSSICAPDSVPRQWLDSPVLRAETGTHCANCAVLRRDSSSAAPGLVLDMPVIVHRQVPFYAFQGSRQRAVSFGPDCSEYHCDSPVAVH